MLFVDAYAEMAHVNEFRNSVLYGGKVNSIAEWMLSPEWTTPSVQMPSTGFIRGFQGFSDARVGVYTNSCHGEIDVRETPPIL